MSAAGAPGPPSAGTMSALVAGLSAHGGRTALVGRDRALTYTELVDETDRLANALLGLGLAQGDRFAFTYPNGIEIVLCHLACARAGVVAVPVSQRATEDDLVFQLGDSGALAIAYDEGTAELVLAAASRLERHVHTIGPDGDATRSLDELVALGAPGPPPASPQPGDMYSVIYTGGTTGAPKAAVQTHAGWVATVDTAVEAWRVRADDRHLLSLPMTHVAWFSCPAYLHVGATVFPLERWDPGLVLDLVARERLTTLNMIPTMLGDLLEARQARPELDLSSIRLLTLAGSPTPEEMIYRAREAFGPVLGMVYGLTESAGGVTFLLPEDATDARIRSCGRTGRNVTLEILDDGGNPLPAGERGEIAISGDQVSPRYLRDPEGERTSRPGGRFLTGDIGYVDDDGYVFIVDRRKEMIITGGFNVYPREVEETLYEHPDVLEAVVVGGADPRWIEAVHAYVALRPGSATTAEALRLHCRSRLAHYKVPKAFHFEHELPRTVVGKFDRRALRERLAAGHRSA